MINEDPRHQECIAVEIESVESGVQALEKAVEALQEVA
jgi:hypothetical protein